MIDAKLKKEIHEILKAPLSENQNLEKRKYNEETRERIEGEYQRDYTRIMYSSSFRRLQGKMQLLGVKNDQFFRNRLTHSLEVAQIARSLAFQLGYDMNESYIVETGALAHDIGNPPFGHAGERVLNELCKEIGGFEGNAQTLRILTTIEMKRSDFQGINLTYRSLLSVVKYFKKRSNEASGKFIYDEDYEFLLSMIHETGVSVRTLDVQIVDLADEIAYAAHDLEDGLRQKLFTMDEILHEYAIEYGESNSFKKLNEIVEKSRVKANFGKKGIDSTEYLKLFRKEITSAIIFTLIHDISLIEVSDEARHKTGTMQIKELGFKEHDELAKGLKYVVFKCINHNDEVYSYEQKGKIALEFLYDIYIKSPDYLPPEYRAKNVIKKYETMEHTNEKKLQERLIADYISGMMDSFAISQYEKFSKNQF